METPNNTNLIQVNEPLLVKLVQDKGEYSLSFKPKYGFDESKMVDIKFHLFESFEISSEDYDKSFGHFSAYSRESLLNDVDLQIMHLNYYDAYVVIHKGSESIAIKVPEHEKCHVIGTRGSNLNTLKNSYNLKNISVRSIHS